MTETKDKIEGIITKQVYGLICECGGGGLDGVGTCKKCEGTGIHDWRFNTAISDIEALIAESNREAYTQGAIDAIEATKIEKKSQEIAEAELSLKKAMGLSLSHVETLNEIVKFHGFNEASEQQSRKAKRFLSKLAENDTNP